MQQQLTNWQQLHIMATRSGPGQGANGPRTYNENRKEQEQEEDEEEAEAEAEAWSRQTMTERNLLPFVDMPLVNSLAQLAHPLSVMDWAVKSIMII